ncbi:MAG: hypothetical protein CMC74_02945 [Flavobacteriaceae bacterium]|nr:hypothetical protein [Flavobacteriaceae bacterium]|tara:strand:- start:26069 stop:27310 length:1242 start_codon:yes stop_codon:yes gene_type:complete
MLKRLLIVFTLLFSVSFLAQQGTTSPYSFFGIGSLKFKGTVENRSMGGLGVYSDSIHLNIQNPAAVSELKLVNFSIAGSHKFNTLSTEQETQRVTTTTLDYLAIGIPMGKFGASFGLIPYTSSGYKLQSQSDVATTQYSGSGGLNKIFVALSYRLFKGLSVGIDANYDFGNIENTAISTQEDIQFGTQEINRSDLLGFSFNFGALYKTMLTEELESVSSFTYTPETDFASENSRTISTILTLPNGNFTTIDNRDIVVSDTDFTFPSQFTLGTGIGKPKKWFLGGEYTSQKTSNFTNRTFELDNVTFEDASKFKLGGFYIPNYNSFTSYWKRIVYRAGFRFEETGININGEAIDEFGISFGLGMPLRRSFSNVNLGFEIGRRGTQNNGLVSENFFNIFVSLSLNDKWFEKRYYD